MSWARGLIPWWGKVLMVAPLAIVLYIIGSCAISQNRMEADRDRIEMLEQQVFEAQDNVIRQISSLTQSQKLELDSGDPERIRLRTISLCSLSAMEADATLRNQYKEACKVLGRADRALQDEQRRQGLDASLPSTDGF